MAAPDAQQGTPAAIKSEPEEEAAAAALAAVRSPGSRSANPSAGATDSRDEAISEGSEDMEDVEDQPQGRLSGSQSHSTFPTERGQQQGAPGHPQPGSFVPPQQLQQLQQLAMLAQPGGHAMFASPQTQSQSQRGRRNARQQEQNKQVGLCGRQRLARRAYNPAITASCAACPSRLCKLSVSPPRVLPHARCMPCCLS